MASRTSLSRSIPASARRLLWPGLSAAVMLGITLWLGVWQIERLHWKQRIIAEIDRAEAAPAISLPAAPTPFEKVEAVGILRGDLVAHYGSEVRSTVDGPKLGAQLVVPLERPGQKPILVDRGWYPDGDTPPAETTPARVIGYIRPPEPAGRFAPGPDLVQRRFWSLDPAAIGASLGLSDVAPYTLVVLGPANAAQALPRPSNDHLGYAVTWFGLALCLVGIFAAFAYKSLRR